MTVLADKLIEAFNVKNNSIESFVWKGEKKHVNKKIIQDEIKLVDASPEQLQSFYNHCKTMLYNKDRKNPGRYTLLNIIKEQRVNCNAELFLRYLATGDPANGIKPYPRFSYFQALKTFLDNNKEVLPKNVWSTTPITVITETPAEFSEITIDQVYRACLDSLGVFQRKHLTNNFIAKMGLWFTPTEMSDLVEKDNNGKTINRLTVVRTRLDLKNNIHLKIDPNGLSYKEFRAMINLQSKKYSELTTEQLIVLRNKVLFRLENEVMFHASQWEKKIDELEKVAKSKGIELE